jgi:hypothetical protein
MDRATTSAHWWDQFVSGSACRDASLPRRLNAATGRRNQTQNWIRNDVLEGSRRWAGKQSLVPVSKDREELKQGQCRGADPDQDNRGHHDHERHYRVHHDTELAMIGVTTNGVYMRYLGHGQQRQQEQANNSCRSQSAWP